MTNFEKAVKMIEENDLTNLKKLIEEDRSILDEKDTVSENSLLHIAVLQDHLYDMLDLTEYLIQQGIDINSLNCFSQTALHLTVVRSSRNLVRLLLDSGVDPNVRTEYGQTCLHEAVSISDNREIIRMILAKTDIDILNSSSQTALQVTIENGMLNSAKYLIVHGADIYLKDREGRTALDYIDDEKIRNEFLFIYHNREKILEELTRQNMIDYN